MVCPYVAIFNEDIFIFNEDIFIFNENYFHIQRRHFHIFIFNETNFICNDNYSHMQRKFLWSTENFPIQRILFSYSTNIIFIFNEKLFIFNDYKEFSYLTNINITGNRSGLEIIIPKNGACTEASQLENNVLALQEWITLTSIGPIFSTNYPFSWKNCVFEIVKTLQSCRVEREARRSSKLFTGIIM